MGCKAYEAGLMEILYDEIDPERRKIVEDHLSKCADCRTELETLAGTRASLAGGRPEVPEAPRVIFLAPGHFTSGGSQSFFGRYRMFAAGFAAALVMLAAGLAAGFYLAPERTLALKDHPGLTAQADLVDRQQFERELDARDARIQQWIDQRTGETEATFSRFSTALDSRRKQDLRFVLGEIMATEAWTGQAIGENRRYLKNLTQVNRPAVTRF